MENNGLQAAIELGFMTNALVEDIEREVRVRTFQAANELQNSLLQVLRGQRSGRIYKVPGTYRRQRDKYTGKMQKGRYYRASAPGEAPARRTGVFRNSFHRTMEVAGHGQYRAVTRSKLTAKNGKNLGALLENGAPKMAPRPFKEPVLDKAMPRIKRIYREPFVR